MAELVESARKSNGGATAYLKHRIKQFELRYEMSSEDLLDRLASGDQKETGEIAEWLFVLATLNEHAG